jgi:hypothetical protein
MEYGKSSLAMINQFRIWDIRDVGQGIRDIWRRRRKKTLAGGKRKKPQIECETSGEPVVRPGKHTNL